MKNHRIHTNKVFYERRKNLRNALTPQEKILWSCIKNRKLGCKFQRQHSIGPYITDFYCAEKKLIVELDGSHHVKNKKYDDERTYYLEMLGYKVIRFWNNEVTNNLKGVLIRIQEMF